MKIIFNYIYIVLYPLLFSIIIELIHRGNVTEFSLWITQSTKEFLYNYALMFALMNVFIIIKSKKLYIIASTLIGILFSILAYISKLKLDLRGEPLSILDFRLLNEALAISESFDFNLSIPIILIVYFLIICVFVFRFIKNNINIKQRATFTLLSIFIIIIFLSLDINKLYKIGVSIPADVSWNHDENGFLLATVVDSKFMFLPEPENYSYKSVAKIIDEIQDYSGNQVYNESSQIKPNIIFVMSESFWDPEIASNLKTNKDPIPNFRELTKNNISGLLTVPGIGGGTANTEFEVLTGFSKEYIPNYNMPYNPYNTYINGDLNSLASELSSSGYNTTAIHTYHSWFYRRNEVYKNLGFNKFIPIEFISSNKKYGQFLDDSVINDLIINELNNSNERDFIYAVTMQSHGPYDIYQEEEIKVTSDVNNSKAKTEIENYLNSIHHSDQRLHELLNYLENYNEPTVLVFFGDHIPPLGNEIYEEIDFDIGNKEGRQTPYLIWSNYSNLVSKESNMQEKNININANLLGALLLKSIGYKGSAYFSYLSQIINNNSTELIDNIYMLQYDALHGKKYFNEITNKSENKSFTVGNDLFIREINLKRFENYSVVEFIGEGFSNMTQVKIDKSLYPLILRGDSKAYSIIPNEIELSKESSLMMVIKDSRDIEIKVSNEVPFNKVLKLKNEDLFNGWIERKLDGSQNWEIFDIKEDFVIVRTDLGYSDDANLDVSPYYVLSDNKILEDYNADQMNSKNLSDIYANGYLYISISKEELMEFVDNIDISSIKQWFNKGDYNLYLENN